MRQPRDLLINAEIVESTRRLSVRKRTGEISNMHSARNRRIAGFDSSVRHRERKFAAEELRMESWAESKWMACRAHGRVMRDVPLYFPATHVLRKTCIRMENQRDLIERIRAEQARLVNSRKRAFQPENIHDDDGTSQRNPINEFITVSTAALLKNLLDVEIISLTKRNVS